MTTRRLSYYQAERKRIRKERDWLLGRWLKRIRERGRDDAEDTLQVAACPAGGRREKPKNRIAGAAQAGNLDERPSTAFGICVSQLPSGAEE